MVTVVTLGVRSGSVSNERSGRDRLNGAERAHGSDGRERLPRLDKLGVTGSSPVPPIPDHKRPRIQTPPGRCEADGHEMVTDAPFAPVRRRAA
jgi:hypothetical protein